MDRHVVIAALIYARFSAALTENRTLQKSKVFLFSIFLDCISPFYCRYYEVFRIRNDGE